MTGEERDMKTGDDGGDRAMKTGNDPRKGEMPGRKRTTRSGGPGRVVLLKPFYSISSRSQVQVIVLTIFGEIFITL